MAPGLYSFPSDNIICNECVDCLFFWPHKGQIGSSLAEFQHRDPHCGYQSSKTHSGEALADGTIVGEGHLGREENDQELEKG